MKIRFKYTFILLVGIIMVSYPRVSHAQSYDTIYTRKLIRVEKLYDSLEDIDVKWKNPGWNLLVTACDEIIKSDTLFYKAWALYYRSYAYYFLDNHAQARADNMASIELYPYIFENYSDISLLDEQQYGTHGNCEERSKIWKKAEENYLKLVAYKPLNAEFRYELGEIRKNIGDICKNKKYMRLALNDFIKAIQLDSTYEPAWIDLGSYHLQKDSAIFYLEKGILKNPASTDIRVSLISTLYAQKKYKKALKVINDAVPLDPDYYLWYEWRTVIEENLGMKEEAKRDTKIYRKLKGE